MKGNLATILKRYFPARFAGAVSLAPRVAREIVHAQTFQPVGLQEFLSLELPPRAMLLSPLLPERSLSMLYAPTGMGRSWFGSVNRHRAGVRAPLLRSTASARVVFLIVDGRCLLPGFSSIRHLAAASHKIPETGFGFLPLTVQLEST